MADDSAAANSKPASALQKPPGYRDAPAPPARPPPRKAAQLPPALRHPGKPAPARIARRPEHRRHRPPPRRSLCCRLCCCLSLVLFTLAFLTALAAGLCYLYFQPRVPSLRLQSLSVTRFNVSTRPDGSGTFLDAAASAKIFASNPNARDVAFSYGDGDARVYVADEDGDIPLDPQRLPGFDQGRRNATVLRLAASARSVLVDDSVGARLRSRYRSGEVRFGVEVRTRLGVRVRGKAMRRVPIRVQCRPASLRQLSRRGRTTLPKCDVYLFRWINLH